MRKVYFLSFFRSLSAEVGKFSKDDLFIALSGPSASPPNIVSSEPPQMTRGIPLAAPPLVFPPPPPAQGMESRYMSCFSSNIHSVIVS
jgi:hypothetical protein